MKITDGTGELTEMTLTAPIEKLTGSTQAQDVAASRGPNDVWMDLYRVKAYNKWVDVAPFTNPARWEFRQPMMVAAAKTCFTWEETNRTFLGQLHECNMSCDFCYRGAAKETVDVSPEQYVQAFRLYNEAFPESRAGVLRISGGEVFLYQEWASGVVEAVGREEWENDEDIPYIWIDTNLSLPLGHTSSLDHYWHTHVRRCDSGLVGCFKPGLWNLEQQIDIGVQIFNEFYGDLFFSWASGDTDTLSDDEFRDFLVALNENIQYAPLRMYIQRINYNYAAVKEQNYDWEEKHTRSMERVVRRRQVWAEWCAAQYPVWLCNIPDHLIELG